FRSHAARCGRGEPAQHAGARAVLRAGVGPGQSMIGVDSTVGDPENVNLERPTTGRGSAARNDGTRILNGDFAETAGSSPLWVGMPRPEHSSSTSTTSKSLMVRRTDLSARTKQSGCFPSD